MISADDGFVQLFMETAKAASARVFARFDGEPITFGALQQMSDAFAVGLRRLGVARGDRVAVMLNNSPATLATLFGLAKAGAVWVPINTQQRGDGLRYVLDHATPTVLVADVKCFQTIQESRADLSKTRIITSGGGDTSLQLEDLLTEDCRFDEPTPLPDDQFAIMYTSGTTGRPKGVLVSHRMMRLSGEGALLVAAAHDGDVLFVWEPLYHIGGAQLIVLPLIRNVELALVDRFSASRFWDQVRRYGATHIHYLGGILQILFKSPPSDRDRAHGVRAAWGGGCPKDLWPHFEKRFGIRIHECYGMTEASSVTTYNDSGLVGSVGRPVPWFSLRILDAAGNAMPAGEKGEIVVQTSVPGAIFAGYFDDSQATARSLRHGALHTGDLGSLDETGNLTFHGRMTDSVRCKGENVSAWEVEHVAAAHPDVEDCAMIGVSADIGEQDIKLFVKPKNGTRLDLPALSAWLGQRLAPYQNPRYIKIHSEFQRTPSQRIIKRELPTALDDCWDRLGETKRMSTQDSLKRR